VSVSLFVVTRREAVERKLDVRALRKKVPCSPPRRKSSSRLMGHEMGKRSTMMIHTSLRAEGGSGPRER
jgi:hypothetical protein